VLMKLDPNTGAIEKKSGLGTSSQRNNAGRGVAVDSAGCVFVTGSYDDYNLTFHDFRDGTHTFSAPPAISKLFVAKYCATCSTSCIPATITTALQSPFVLSGPSPTQPIKFTVTASGKLPLSFSWYRKTTELPPPSGTGYTITFSADGYSSTLELTGQPTLGTGLGYSVRAANECCDCYALSRASIHYLVDDSGSGNFTALRILSETGLAFSVEYRDDLFPTTPWRFLTNTIGNGFQGVPFDPNPNPFMRFYRIPLQPDQ
jgi:hypothetical protein